MRAYCETCDCILANEVQWRHHVEGKKHRKAVLRLSRPHGADAQNLRTVRLAIASRESHLLQSIGRLKMLVLTPGMSGSLRRVMMCVCRFAHTVAIAVVHPRMVAIRLRDLNVRFETAAPKRATACISGAVGAAEFHQDEGSGGIVPLAGELRPPQSLFLSLVARAHCGGGVGVCGGQCL
jgi:hypothetical protein